MNTEIAEQSVDNDLWSSDEFEDMVASALIACFEQKVKKNRGAAPADRLTDERIAMMRAAGPYIPSNSRIILGPNERGRWCVDTKNDGLHTGCLALKPIGQLAESRPGSYLFLMHMRRVNALGHLWQKRRSGTIYEALTMDARGDGIHGERRFFTVAADGEVWSCDQSVRDERGAVHTHGGTWLTETESYAAVSLQMLADRRFCWSITAQEKQARAHLGCMSEEIKSLLYARSLPMTATGRKRPILHLVEAHKRRIRNGTDVDVSAFLRGTQVVEIGGTVFRVNPPPTMVSKVTEQSRKKFFAEPA